MHIPVREVERMFNDLCEQTRATKADVRVMVGLLMDKALYRNRFSPFSIPELETILRYGKETAGKQITIEVDKPAMKLINAHRKPGIFVGMEAISTVCSMAKQQGVGIIGIYNSTYHDLLSTYARAIAKNDCIGIVTANGGPSAVVPYGGTKAICGTNPLAYAVPTNEYPIVFDGATAQYAYGTIRLAREQKKKLEKHIYFDSEGQFTIDPESAVALQSFGGYKGYAINLLLDIMTGLLVRAKSGLQVHNEHDLGSLFIAIDPGAFGSIDIFKKQSTALVLDILRVPSQDTKFPVRVPGYHSEKKRQQIIQTGTLEVDDSEWMNFETFYRKHMKI